MKMILLRHLFIDTISIILTIVLGSSSVVNAQLPLACNLCFGGAAPRFPNAIVSSSVGQTCQEVQIYMAMNLSIIQGECGDLQSQFRTFCCDVDGGPSFTALLNEFQPNPSGSDPSSQSIELLGHPNADFLGCILVVDCDPIATGEAANYNIERATNVVGEVFDENGLLLVDVLELENNSFIMVLLNSVCPTGTDATSTINPDNVIDAIGIPDEVEDVNLCFPSNINDDLNIYPTFQYTGNDPRLVFRDGVNRDWYAINDPTGGVVITLEGLELNPNLFVFGDPFATSFGRINPSVEELITMSPTLTVSPSTSLIPSSAPSISTSPTASTSPSNIPSDTPSTSHQPSIMPSKTPSYSSIPSSNPTAFVSTSSAPSSLPSATPSYSNMPSLRPTPAPSESPMPSNSPSLSASPSVSYQPSSSPTFQKKGKKEKKSSTPTNTPSLSLEPSRNPSSIPTSFPSLSYRPSSSSSPTFQGSKKGKKEKKTSKSGKKLKKSSVSASADNIVVELDNQQEDSLGDKEEDFNDTTYKNLTIATSSLLAALLLFRFRVGRTTTTSTMKEASGSSIGSIDDNEEEEIDFNDQQQQHPDCFDADYSLKMQHQQQSTLPQQGTNRTSVFLNDDMSSSSGNDAHKCNEEDDDGDDDCSVVVSNITDYAACDAHKCNEEDHDNDDDCSVVVSNINDYAAYDAHKCNEDEDDCSVVTSNSNDQAAYPNYDFEITFEES